jgi:hypothetical protein
MGFQRTGRYDLMHMKTKVIGWKENRGNRNIDIEDSQKNIRVHRRQVLKIWEQYVTELHGRPNRPDRPQNLDVGNEEGTDEDEKGFFYFSR